MIGGAHSTTLLYNDIWVQTGATGTTSLSWFLPLPPTTRPNPRYVHTGAYDPTTNELLVFGGNELFQGCSNDYRPCRPH